MENGINDAIADWRVIRGAEIPFSNTATLADIFCLFAFFEAVVLYDRVWANPKDLEGVEAFKTLIEKGVIKPTKDVPDILPNDYKEVNKYALFKQLRRGKFQKLTKLGFTNEAYENTYARYIYATQQHLDSVVDPIFNVFIPYFEYKVRKTQISSLYDKVSLLYKKEIDDLISIGSPIKLFIPPIPAVILNRSNSNYRIVYEALYLRDEFEQFREKYRSYQNVINNPSVYTLKELINAKQESLFEVEQALEKVSKKRNGTRLMTEIYRTIIDASIGMSNYSFEVNLTSPISKILDFSIREIAMQIIKGRARCLFDLWKAAIDIKGYDQLANKHFKLEENAFSDDITSLADLGKWVDTQKQRGHK